MKYSRYDTYINVQSKITWIKENYKYMTWFSILVIIGFILLTTNFNTVKPKKLIKVDSIFVRVDSLENTYLGCDYYFYSDSIVINVIISNKSPLRQKTDTTIIVKDLNGNLVYIGDINNNYVKLLMNKVNLKEIK